MKHQTEIKKLRRKQYHLQQKNKELASKLVNMDINYFINRALKYVRFEKRAALVLDLVMSGKMFGDRGIEGGKEFMRQEVRKTFTAWRLCQAKDTAHQGCLNLQGCEAVRQVEELEKREQGMMPSKSAIWREGDELLREVGYELFLPEHIDSEMGELVKLNYEQVLRFAIADNGLMPIAVKESIEMGFSVDAGALTSGTSHIFAGCKNLDVRSRDKDGNLMYVHYDEDGKKNYKNIQSKANVYLILMLYCRDGKMPYRHFFKSWFEFINEVKKNGLPYRDDNNPAIKPILTRVPQDVSSIQKSLNMGGACKACDMFCHMCACKSYGANCQLMRWREGHLRCRRYCLNQPNPPTKCFHWSVDEKYEIQQKKQVLKTMILYDEIWQFRLMPNYLINNIFKPSMIKNYCSHNPKFRDTHVEEDADVIAHTKVLTCVTDANRHSDPSHIEFQCPKDQCALRTAYSSMLDNELVLRKMFIYINYSVKVKQKYLRLSVQNGEYIKDLRRAIERWCEVGTNDKLIEVDDAVLCILHLELRCSENKLAHLFNDGFAHRKTKALIDKYISEIEAVVNEGKIGLSTHQNQWTFPINKERDGVASEFSLKGEFGRSILAKSSRLVDIALKYHTQTERDEYNAVLSKYHEVLKFLNRREEFSPQMIQEFQKLCDEYGQMWRDVAGRDGQTNYEHNISSSHCTHFFDLYGNLYRFSQQGFEAMMSKIKCIYHKCTSRGGHGAKIRSHILQICHFLIRSMLWNSGHGEAYFKAKYKGQEDRGAELFD